MFELAYHSEELHLDTLNCAKLRARIIELLEATDTVTRIVHRFYMLISKVSLAVAATNVAKFRKKTIKWAFCCDFFGSLWARNSTLNAD